MNKTTCPNGMVDTCCENYDNCTLSYHDKDAEIKRLNVMTKTKWNIEAVKAYETGQGVELVNDPYPHYVPKTLENKEEEMIKEIAMIGGIFETEEGAKGFQNLLIGDSVVVKFYMPNAVQPILYWVANQRSVDDLKETLDA